jgi:hypothetical protein
LNGGFETQIDTAGPPDHWTVELGTWATHIDLLTDGAGISGLNYIDFPSIAHAAKIVSDFFSVTEGQIFKLEAGIKCHTTGTEIIRATLIFYDSALASTSSITIEVGSGSTTGWEIKNAFFAAPANSRYGAIILDRKNGAGVGGFYIDSVRAIPLRPSGMLTFTADTLLGIVGTEYLAHGYHGDGGSRAAEIQVPIPFDCAINNLHANLLTASLDVNYVLDVRINGVGSTLTATIAGGANTASDLVSLEPVVKGDLLSVRVVTTLGAGPIYTSGDDLTLSLALWA